MSASDTLRAGVGALPEHQRAPWEYKATSVFMGEPRSHGYIASGPGPHPVSGAYEAPGQLIAIAASPPVALALADLLDAILPKPTDMPFDTIAEMERWIWAAQDHAKRVAAAIERAGGGT